MYPQIRVIFNTIKNVKINITINIIINIYRSHITLPTPDTHMLWSSPAVLQKPLGCVHSLLRVVPVPAVPSSGSALSAWKQGISVAWVHSLQRQDSSPLHFSVVLFHMTVKPKRIHLSTVFIIHKHKGNAEFEKNTKSILTVLVTALFRQVGF